MPSHLALSIACGSGVAVEGLGEVGAPNSQRNSRCNLLARWVDPHPEAPVTEGGRCGIWGPAASDTYGTYMPPPFPSLLGLEMDEDKLLSSFRQWPQLCSGLSGREEGQAVHLAGPAGTLCW